MSLCLSPVLDTAAAMPLRVQLRQAITSGQPLVIDAAGVERVGQACLQVLVAAEAAASQASLPFKLVDPSPALSEMTALAGLGFLLAA